MAFTSHYFSKTVSARVSLCIPLRIAHLIFFTVKKRIVGRQKTLAGTIEKSLRNKWWHSVRRQGRVYGALWLIDCGSLTAVHFCGWMLMLQTGQQDKKILNICFWNWAFSLQNLHFEDTIVAITTITSKEIFCNSRQVCKNYRNYQE